MTAIPGNERGPQQALSRRVVREATAELRELPTGQAFIRAELQLLEV
jgi:hypothetical protein